jgi:hypothetical protein
MERGAAVITLLVLQDNGTHWIKYATTKTRRYDSDYSCVHIQLWEQMQCKNINSLCTLSDLPLLEKKKKKKKKKKYNFTICYCF